MTAIICPKCGSTERIRVSNRRPSGLCKPCSRAQTLRWKARNAKHVREYNAGYYTTTTQVKRLDKKKRAPDP